MADAQSKAEKLAAARKKAEELKKKKAAGAKAKKDKAPADKKEDEAAAVAEPSEEKPKEEAQEEEPPTVEPSTPAEAEPTTTASPFAPTDTESPLRQGATTSESTAELEAKLLELEKELDAVKGARDEAQMTADALEKKVVSLELLHKEDESQINRLQTDLADARNENVDLKNKLQKSEAEALRLSKQENQDRGGTDNDHLDELEDEERKKLEARIRELESHNSELQRGIWQERRRDMQPPMDDGIGQFTTVPLSPSAARKQGGFGDFFTTGLNALTGGGGHEHQDDDGFLDDDEDFDEDAFRKAQEETAKARIERIKEVKRGLKNWEGWRLDLVEGRRGGGEGLGEIFENYGDQEEPSWVGASSFTLLPVTRPGPVVRRYLQPGATRHQSRLAPNPCCSTRRKGGPQIRALPKSQTPPPREFCNAGLLFPPAPYPLSTRPPGAPISIDSFKTTASQERYRYAHWDCKLTRVAIIPGRGARALCTCKQGLHCIREHNSLTEAIGVDAPAAQLPSARTKPAKTIIT